MYMLSWKLPGPFAWPIIGNAISMRKIEGVLFFCQFFIKCLNWCNSICDNSQNFVYIDAIFFQYLCTPTYIPSSYYIDVSVYKY